MRKWVLFLLFMPSLSHAYVNLKDVWVEDGGYKMSRQDQYIGGASSNTISRAWDGTTIKLFGGKGELLTWVTYLIGGASDATNVMVQISSFTGTGSAAGSGFSAVTVSSSNVWDYTSRPYSLYKYSYLQQIGMSQSDIAWDPAEYDEQQLPARWQIPCTVSGARCPPTNALGTGTAVYTQRTDANKFYPDAAVPIEEFGISSFTVSASSSQAIGGEVYVSTSLPAGTYIAKLTVYEGITVSTTIPISLLIYNVTLPPLATVPVIGYVRWSDLDMRLTGTRFPASDTVDPYLTNHLRVAAFLHRHKLTEIGDQVCTSCGTNAHDYPTIDYQKHIDGSAYKETYGLSFNTGPGYGTGDTFYMIGTYGNWVSTIWSTTTLSGANGFCTNVSSWTAYCASNNLNCQLYTKDDEASQTLLAGEVTQFSTWMSTVAACASGGKTLNYWQTGSLPTVASSAPAVNTVASTYWLGASTATWKTEEAFYQASSTHSVWGYNAGIGVDSILNTQEEGLGSREPMWGMYKTNQAGWYLWQINYWNDSNNTGQTQNGYNANTNNDNDMAKNSKTFGYDLFPSTSAYQGHFGYHFSNGDGTMLYPATDMVNASENYGFNGVIGSWKLNMLTRGIQDVDLLKMAYTINPSLTTALVNNLIGDVMYLRQCVTLSDCSYSYGVRPWSETENAYETTRESLYQMILTGEPGVGISGNATIKGGGTF